jgi:hypothetical protein
MDEDIYIVDTRNADHRTGQGAVVRPGGGGAGGGRVLTATPARAYGPPTYGQPTYGQPQMFYAGPPQSPFAASLFGRITGGQLVDLVAQIFAALMPLPAAPVATSETATDVANSILYQGALAQHAKRDEQVRTLGNLVTKLLG